MNSYRWKKFEILFQNETNFIFLERDQATVYFLDFKWQWSLRIEVVIVAWFLTGSGSGRDANQRSGFPDNRVSCHATSLLEAHCVTTHSRGTYKWIYMWEVQ